MDIAECQALVAELLIAERKKAGLRQGDLARKLGQHQSWLSRLESGGRDLKLCEFFQIARAIGFNPHQALRRVFGRPNGPRGETGTT
jgi:transcriptional regulator with XRE-family HTH domain